MTDGLTGGLTKTVFLGPHSVLSPSGLLSETLSDYRSGTVPLRRIRWKTQKIELLETIGSLPVTTGVPPLFESPFLTRLKKAFEVAIVQLAAKTGPGRFDAVLLGQGRLQTLELNSGRLEIKRPSATALLDWLAMILQQNGFDAPRDRIFCIETACASGITQMRTAHRTIREGRYNRLLLLSFDLAEYSRILSMEALSVLTRRERPSVFSEDRDGFARSEAVAAIVISSRNETSEAPIAIRSVALSSDGGGFTDMEENGRGIATCMKASLQDAGIKAPSFIKAHGTGTRMNDEIECRALENVFKDADKEIPLMAVKSQFGHTLNCSGLFELLLAYDVLTQDHLMQTVGSTGLPFQKRTFLPKQAISKSGLRSCLGLAMGFGGINGSYCLERLE